MKNPQDKSLYIYSMLINPNKKFYLNYYKTASNRDSDGVPNFLSQRVALLKLK